MERVLGKKYRLKSSVNFEEYLEFLDASFLLRKILPNLSNDCVLSKNAGGSYSIHITTIFKNFTVVFTPGLEFESIRPDGEKVKSVLQIENNKLIEDQVDAKGIKAQHVTEYIDDLMHVTISVEGWDKQCIRTYELVK